MPQLMRSWEMAVFCANKLPKGSLYPQEFTAYDLQPDARWDDKPMEDE